MAWLRCGDVCWVDIGLNKVGRAMIQERRADTVDKKGGVTITITANKLQHTYTFTFLAELFRSLKCNTLSRSKGGDGCRSKVLRGAEAGGQP